MESISLSRLNEYIRRAIAVNFAEPIWIICELVSVKINKGHYYLDIAERQGDEIIAQSSAVIWKGNATLLSRTINADLDQVLKEGNEVRIAVQVEYHIRYGLKLNIENIDAAFTLGKIAQKRAAIIQRLIDENLFQKNLEKSLPSVIKRMAIITSMTAAGKHDFEDQLINNNYDYTFSLAYFPCAMQGTTTESEVSAALENIIHNHESFDCIIIIRGGGSKLDLMDFDSYEIAKWISLSPIPVLTGIGHKIDESIADLSAFENLKTPTAVAEYIIQHNADFEIELQNKYEQIQKAISVEIQRNKSLLDNFKHEFVQLIMLHNKKQENVIEKYKHQIQLYSVRFIQNRYSQLDNIKFQIESNNPLSILEKGYVMVTKNNVRIKERASVDTGELLHLQFRDGEIDVVSQ